MEISIFSGFLCFILSGFSVLSAEVYASPCVRITGDYLADFHIDYHIDYQANKEQQLQLNFIKTLPDNKVILAGHYYHYINNEKKVTMPVIYFSMNQGKSWKVSRFNFKREIIEGLQTQGRANIWLLLSEKNEGTLVPARILKSENAGRDWCQIQLDLFSTGAILQWVENFVFFDALHGKIALVDADGGRVDYYTKNGGLSWNLLWKIPASQDIETTYSMAAQNEDYPHAPVWKKSHGRYKIMAAMRLVKAKGRYIVEKNTFNDPVWQVQSMIPESVKAKLPTPVILKNHKGS